MPEGPTATELSKEAEQETAVFAQAVNVEKLLDLLGVFDPTKNNLVDNEEIRVHFIPVGFLYRNRLLISFSFSFVVCVRERRSCTGRV